MIAYIVRYVLGFLKVKINGEYLERFINLCVNKNIVIWNLNKNQEDKIYEFYISRKNFIELKEIAKKTNTKVSIIKKIGLPFFLYKYKKRKLFFLGMIVCAVLVYVISLFIWDIEIKGVSYYTDEEILKFIEQEGIDFGILRSKVNADEIEEKIRENYEEVAWVACEVKGTKITINIKESLDTKTKNQSKVPCDIIANKDGKITSIITRNGTPLVKKGTVFKKGDVLISGVINIYNDYEEVLETNYIAADGDIFAETEYMYTDSFNMTYYEKEYTKNTKVYYSFILANKYITPYKPKVTYQNYDIVSETKKIKVGNSFFLPVAIQKNTVREYNAKRCVYDKDNATKKASEHLEKFIKNLEEKGVQIVKNNVKIKINEEKCIAKGELILIEPIGKIRNINSNSLNNKNKGE